VADGDIEWFQSGISKIWGVLCMVLAVVVLVFAVVGTVAFLLGAGLVGGIATGFALFAALLNAAFGICLGCQIYPLVTRLRGGATASAA